MQPQRVAVIGGGQTPSRSQRPDKTYVELAQDAAKAALDDAGMTPDDIDAVAFSMAPTQFMDVNECEKWAVDSIWAAGKPLLRVHTGGATGGSALQPGFTHVASSMFRTVLVVGADRVSETPDARHVLNLIWDRFYEHNFALNTVTMTALASHRQMHMYGTTEEQFARVVVRGIEAALQVMGRAGAYQAKDVHNALATAIGGPTASVRSRSATNGSPLTAKALSRRRRSSAHSSRACPSRPTPSPTCGWTESTRR
ncbi:MAG: hypothetical protein Q8L49_04300 [Burkholderiaceae bacterium]|nr:hypothetical protein [Burkholderiaceae bacterium]